MKYCYYILLVKQTNSWSIDLSKLQLIYQGKINKNKGGVVLNSYKQTIAKFSIS